MPLLQRVVKPTTRKGKKVLLGREPKLFENTKHAIFFKGRKTSEMLNRFLKDMYLLKKLHSTMLNRKNDYLPFEDVIPIENLMKKQDSSLFMFASNSKKRPNNLVLGRTYDSHLLDMIEVGIESYRGLDDFRTEKVMLGTKPILHFIGDFERSAELSTIKSLLADMFCGERNLNAVALAGIEHVLAFTSDAKEGKIHARSYRILLKKSGKSTPRIELEEMGPAFVLVVRRFKIASDDLMNTACKTPQELKAKPKKNIVKNKLGTTLGRVHIRAQQINKLQMRRIKGLRKTPEERMAERRRKNFTQTGRKN